MFPNFTDVECPRCRSEALLYRVMEDGDKKRIFAECDPDDGCDHDYGELGHVDADADEERVEERARELLADLDG